MKRIILTVLIGAVLSSGALFAEVKEDDIDKRMNDLEKLFEEEKKDEEEIEKDSKDMIKELEKLMKQAEENMNKKIAPMLGKKKTGDDVRGIQDNTLGNLGKMVKIIKKMNQKQQQKQEKKKPGKKKKKKKKKQPGKKKKGKGKGKKPGKGAGGSEPAPTDEMTSGSVTDGNREALKNQKKGESAFGKLPKKERDAMHSSEGTKMGAKYSKQLRQFFDTGKDD